jgi:energy-converting hydrogenase A subunit R
MPGAATAVRYGYGLLPTFLATTSYEHHMMNVCDAIDFPMGNVSCTKVEFDSCEIRRQEAKELRDMAAEITALRIPKTEYSPHTPMEMDPGDVNIVSVLDRILADRLPRMDAGDIVYSVSTMGEDEKAYSLLEIRRKTEIDLDSTACIGGDSTDYRALDLVRDSNGLAMSFNGTESAVRGCNVAVMAKDSTVAAVLVQELYNEGIGASTT